MRCEELMRRPTQQVSLEATVAEAARKMRDANIGFLPVCDANGCAIGVVTDRDIAIRACAEGFSPNDTRVIAIMTTGVTSCAPSDDLCRAEMLMTQPGFRSHRALATA